MLRFNTLSLIFYLLSICVSGQEYDFVRYSGGIRTEFYNLNTNEQACEEKDISTPQQTIKQRCEGNYKLVEKHLGLSNSNFYHVLEDHSGNIWLNSGETISKFDGFKWTHYGTNNSILRVNIETDMLLGRDGEVIVATNDLFVYKEGKWSKYSANGFDDKKVMTLGPSGTIYISAEDEIFKFSNNKLSSYMSSTLLPTDKEINYIYYDKNNLLWLLAENDFFYYKSGNWKNLKDQLNPNDYNSNKWFDRVYQTKNGDYIFTDANSSGMVIRDINSPKIINQFFDCVNCNFAETEDGTLYGAGRSFKMFNEDYESTPLFSGDSLREDNYDIFYTSDKQLLLVGDGNFLRKFNPESKVTINIRPNHLDYDFHAKRQISKDFILLRNRTYTILDRNKNELYYVYELLEQQEPESYSTTDFISSYMDQNNKIHVFYKNNLFVFEDGKLNKTLSNVFDKNDSDYELRLVDHNGNYWFNKEYSETKVFINGNMTDAPEDFYFNAEHEVKNVYSLENGSVWIQHPYTHNNNLFYKFSDEKWTQYDYNDFSQERIYGFTTFNNKLWIANSSGKINTFDGTSLEVIPNKVKNSENTINISKVYNPGDGNIYALSGYKIYRYDNTEWSLVFEFDDDLVNLWINNNFHELTYDSRNEELIVVYSNSSSDNIRFKNKTLTINNLNSYLYKLNNTRLNFWPNPSSGTFTVETPSSKSIIQIISADGSIIKSIQSNEHINSFTIDKSGLYFIKVKDSNETYTQKIIIK